MPFISIFLSIPYFLCHRHLTKLKVTQWFINEHWSNWNSKKEVVHLQQFLLMLWICYIQFSQLWFGQVQLKWNTRLNEGHKKEFQLDISCICSYFLEMRLLFSIKKQEKKPIIEGSLQNCHEDDCAVSSHKEQTFSNFSNQCN